QGDFPLPPRATIEFEISWRKKPDFIFALGVDANEKTNREAFRFEVWDRDLVVVRATDDNPAESIQGDGDVANLLAVSPGAGRAHFQVYLDQMAGRCLVYSRQGEALADLNIVAREQKALPGLRLKNNRGDVRLERLRIGRWNGATPPQVAADASL